MKFDPNQPRVSAGNSDGGQWTDGGGGAGGQDISRARSIASRGGRFAGAVPAPRPQGAPKTPDGTPVRLAQAQGGGRRGGSPSGRVIAGRFVETTPQEELQIQLSSINAQAAVSRVRQRDAGWRPRPGLYDSAQGLIRYNEGVRREAEQRERQLDRLMPGHNGPPPDNNPNSRQSSRRDELLQVFPTQPFAADMPEAVGKPFFKRPNDPLQKHDRIDLSKFNKRIKLEGETAFLDPKSGYMISKEKSASNPHGGSTWKLLDRFGRRIGTIAEDGRFLRKMRVMEI